MDIKLTLEVQEYHLRYAHGDINTNVLLQAPLALDLGHNYGNKILVRQQSGLNKNEVLFRKTDELHRLETPAVATYAHGILAHSLPRQNGRRGDQVWITNAPKMFGSTIQITLSVVNLRSGTDLTVALDDVCWIPNKRKMERLTAGEELLTIAGPRKKQNRKTYYTAVVQRLDSAGTAVEVREFLEQDLWKYENLTSDKKIEELFHRRLSMLGPAPLRGSSPELSSVSQYPSLEMDIQHMSIVGDAAVATRPDNVPETASLTITIDREASQARVTEHIRKLMSAHEEKQARRGHPPFAVIPSSPRCNLNHDRCPAPGPFLGYTPSLANPFPTHHHLPDHECPIGAAHKLHCVFSSTKRRDCILGPQYQHTCCHPNVWPWNRKLVPPPLMIDASTAGQGEDELSDLPVEVQPLDFNADRDLDELGRRVFYQGHATEKVYDLNRTFAEAGILGPGNGESENAYAQALVRKDKESDVFADRHLVDDDDDDDNYEMADHLGPSGH